MNELLNKCDVRNRRDQIQNTIGEIMVLLTAFDDSGIAIDGVLIVDEVVARPLRVYGEMVKPVRSVAEQKTTRENQEHTGDDGDCFGRLTKLPIMGKYDQYGKEIQHGKPYRHLKCVEVLYHEVSPYDPADYRPYGFINIYPADRSGIIAIKGGVKLAVEGKKGAMRYTYRQKDKKR